MPGEVAARVLELRRPRPYLPACKYIVFGSMTAHGYRGILAACAALTVLALIVIGVARQATKPASQPA